MSIPVSGNIERMENKARILVVEDEAAIRDGLADVLVYHGYRVDAVSDGREGLSRALSGQYDLLLLDVMLPGRDGFSICDEVRRVDREQPIILLTAKTTDADIVSGLALGADDYVAKPFSIAQLVARIKAVLRRSRTGAAAAAVIRLGDDVRDRYAEPRGPARQRDHGVHAPRDRNPAVSARERASPRIAHGAPHARMGLRP